MNDNLSEFEVCELDSPEGMFGVLQKHRPQVVLMDFTSESSGGFLEAIENFEQELQVVLIIDPTMENEVLHLMPQRVTDYIFRDRLKKLPIMVEQLLVKKDTGGKKFQEDTQSEIKENQERYQSVFENSPDGILLTVTGGNILAANPAACRMFNMSKSELFLARQTEIYDLQDSRLLPAIRKREKHGKVNARLKLIRKGGEKFEGEITSAVFKTANGEKRTSTIIRDISEKQKAEKELRKSEENYRNLFQYNPLPSLIFDLDTFEILQVNEGMVNLYGYTKEEFLKMRIPQLRPPEARTKLQEELQKARTERGQFFPGVINHITKSKKLIKVDIHTHRLEFQKRNCRVAVLNDVTEKEALFDELQEKKDKLAAAQSLAKLGYWELDLDTDKLLWSEQVYKIWEKKRTDFTPTTEYFVKTIHPDFKEMFADQTAISQGEVIKHDIEYKIILENGKTKWIRGKGSFRRNKEGKPVSFGGILQDITNQKEAQEKLRLNEVRQRGILMSQTNYLIRTDLEGRYTYCNEKFQDDFRWIHHDKELMGRDALSTTKPYHREKVKDVFLKCIQNPNQIFQVEIDKLHEKDKKKTTLWDMVCLTDQWGMPVEVQCVGIDITQRVEAEKALLDSNARYEIISKATSDAIYDWDCSTGKMEWSDGFKKLFGYELDCDIDFWLQKLHPDEKQKIEESLQEALDDNFDTWTAEYRFRRSNGEYAVVEERGTILKNEQQVPERMVGAIKDVTEKKKNEEKLKRNEANLRTAQKIAELGYWQFHVRDCRVFWSDYTFKIHERKEEEGQPKLEETLAMVHWEDVEMYTQKFQATLEEGGEHELEHRIVTAQGKVKWLHHRGKTIYDSEGRPVRMEGTVQDITKRKIADLKLLQLNKELEIYTKELIAANKGLEQFSYIVSHNLRSPVANISGLAELIQNGDYEQEIKNKFLAELYSNVKRLDNVIIDLNSTLKLKKKISEKKEKVNFEQIVNDIKESIRDQIQKEKVKVETNFEEVTEMNTVMSYMHSIFYNLISNSIKYRRPDVPPGIKITSEKRNDKLLLIFEDNGLGIDLSKKGDQVFGLYKRFHNHVDGKGVGLFMVKTQVETIGGKISVSSEPDKGTQFVLQFNI